MRPRGLIASQAGPSIEEPGSLQVAGVLVGAQPAPAGVAQQYLAGPFGEGDLTGRPRLHPLFQPVAWNGQPPCGSIYSARPTDALICRIAGVACTRTYAQLCITFHDSARAYVAASIAAQGLIWPHRARSPIACAHRCGRRGSSPETDQRFWCGVSAVLARRCGDRVSVVLTGPQPAWWRVSDAGNWAHRSSGCLRRGVRICWRGKGTL